MPHGARVDHPVDPVTGWEAHDYRGTIEPGLTMSEIRAMTTILRRMFSKRAIPASLTKPLAGIRKRMEMIEKDESVDGFDAEDVSEFEADFMNVGMSHRMYERETKVRKERLKQRIAIQKCFKEKEPRFLTFAENELIRKLHNHNPDEWTVEKLSESFPALPETIQKILRTKWSPKSVEKVLQYDNVAVKNWEEFRAGRLPLNPMLGEHLMKFKNRKIILTDRESLAEQFVPKVEFKKPKSQLFSSIVQTYLDEKEKESDTKLLSQEDNSSKVAGRSDYSENQNLLTASATTDSPTAVKNTEKFALNEERSFTLQSRTNSQKLNVPVTKEGKSLTFDEFVRTKLEDIQQESPEEGITLLNVYRKQVEASQEMQTAEIAAASDNAVTHAEEDTSSKIARRSDRDISIPSRDKHKDFNIVGADDNLLDTRVKVWKKKADTELNYAKPIKIAKHLYKPGMTYRIRDCYYDDDGEFLYRVPGVHDGRPTPLGIRQKARLDKQRGYAARIIKLVGEVDYAVERHARLQKEKEQKTQQILDNKLKPKGDLLLQKQADTIEKTVKFIEN
ncbi:Uncharacterized protein DBV15_03761 [Temnothorax longispinosus]|uniref:Uncharacterized protein n=1 Tax=Temnothorax longispinosus TaxID=300112 RepID=A0A4S2KRB7_9HYME|nr:Uncharacterized protein DBV15_03761 [Temnothorax longispinosus]